MIRAAIFALVWASVGDAGAPAKPTLAALGKPFALRAGQPRTLGQLRVSLTADHRPMERGPNGIELFPITYYSLEWREGKETRVMKELLPQGPSGTRLNQYALFGRYTFTLERGSSEDEVRLTVFNRTCLLRYTYRNQLKHKNGAIIFTENEDLCCSYSDGPNSCDLGVSRAQEKPDPRYCVVYSNQPQATSPEQTCCCRYERGEPLDKECQASCDRLGARH